MKSSHDVLVQLAYHNITKANNYTNNLYLIGSVNPRSMLWRLEFKY